MRSLDITVNTLQSVLSAISETCEEVIWKQRGLSLPMQVSQVKSPLFLDIIIQIVSKQLYSDRKMIQQCKQFILAAQQL